MFVNGLSLLHFPGRKEMTCILAMGKLWCEFYFHITMVCRLYCYHEELEYIEDMETTLLVTNIDILVLFPGPYIMNLKRKLKEVITQQHIGESLTLVHLFVSQL